MLLTIPTHVGHVEAFRLIEVELDSSHLPLSAHGIADVEINLGSVEGPPALVHLIGQALGPDGPAQRFRGLIPPLRFAHRLFRPCGKVNLNVLKAKIRPHLEAESQHLQDLPLDLLRCAEDVGVVLGEAPHAHKPV